MKLSLPKALLGALPLLGMLGLPLEVPAYDDRYSAYAEHGSSTRLSKRELRSFNAFLNSHDEIASELYRDPELINNERFLRGHAELRNWMDDHQEAAAAI